MTSRSVRGASQRDILGSPDQRAAFRHALETALSAREVFDPAERDAFDPPRRIPLYGDWLDSAEARLDELSALPSNWDGYGSEAISPAAREATMKVLFSATSAGDTLPSLVPGVGGSVNLEWRRPGLIFEIEVDPAGRLEAYIFDDAKHEEWEGQYAEIEWRVGEVISRFSDPA